MRFIADLQIHSRYAMATSKDITIKNIEKYGRIKGIDICGTGDVFHPLWLEELKKNLKDDAQNGIYKTTTGYMFVLQGEVSNVFYKDGKLRKVHNIILAKNFEIVEHIIDVLKNKSDLKADGRPVFRNYSCEELVEDMMSIDKKIEIIPAHCMTPWFGIFGSKSGFDSVEECFGDKAKHINAIETGLSADPPMLWRVSKWNKYNLVSNSDAHSYWPWRMGREATVFELKEATYGGIIKAIRTGSGLWGTIEVYPAYGKYHWNGHRACGVRMSPKESAKYKNICPVCRKKMTIGVENRIEELADKPEGYMPENAKPFISTIPLSEMISKITGSGIYSKNVWEIYNKLINKFGSEYKVLLEAPFQEIAEASDNKIAEIVVGFREGRIKIIPGYDGEYGKIVLKGEEEEKPKITRMQKSLADY